MNDVFFLQNLLSLPCSLSVRQMAHSPLINTSSVHLLDAVTAEERQKFDRLSDLYGTHLRSIHVLPNHTDAALFPRGVAVEFGPEAPMFTEPFHPDEFMTFGTSLVPVHGDVPKLEALQNPSRQYKQQILRAVPASESALTLNRRDPATNCDQKGFSYEPTIGVNTNSAMAGLFVGTAVVNNERVQRHFIMVSAGLPALSRELLRRVSQHQTYAAADTNAALGGVAVFTGPRRVSTKLSIREFLSWPETHYAIHAGKRNRLAIAAAIADTLGLDIDTYADQSAGTAGRKLAMPVADTASYELEPAASGGGGGFVYYADAVNAERIQGGMCMQYAPSVGGAFLFGVPHAEHPLGMGWSNSCASAFPTSVGRRLDAVQGYQVASQADRFRYTASDSGSHAFCWHGSLPFNDKLTAATFRERDYIFRASERALGRDPAITEFDLAPVLVMLDQTPAQKASLIGTS